MLLRMIRRRLVALASLAALSGCSRDGPPAAVNSSPAQATLDGFDTRAPVPLLPMMANHQKQSMREHLAAVQAIVAAAAAEDFGAVAQASSRIGYSEQMGQMCSHIGAGAPGFTEQALAFHHAADKIGDAAREHDLHAVLAALSATLTACTGCHAAFKQQVVAELGSESATHATHGR
jgi:predicted small lipoprotein YifL